MTKNAEKEKAEETEGFELRLYVDFSPYKKCIMLKMESNV